MRFTGQVDPTTVAVLGFRAVNQLAVEEDCKEGRKLFISATYLRNSVCEYLETIFRNQV